MKWILFVLVFVKQFWPLTKKQYCSWLSWLGFGLSVLRALGVRRLESSLTRSQKHWILVTTFSKIPVQCSLCKRQNVLFLVRIYTAQPSIFLHKFMHHCYIMKYWASHFLWKPSFILHSILKMKLFWIDILYVTFY